MNPLWLLKFAPWIAAAACLALAGFFYSLLQHEKAGRAKDQAQYQSERAVAAAAAASASEAYRAKEQSDRQKLDEVQTHGKAMLDAARAERDDADRRSASLQRTATAAINALRRATPEAPATAAECDAARNTAAVFAELFRRADEAAGVLAGYADAARIAGEACVAADQVTR